MTTVNATTTLTWRVRLLAIVLTTVAAVVGLMTAAPPSANAAAYPIGVYAPDRINSSQIRGWANLSRDCSGTVGCYNYIKIERSRWWGAEYVNGWWANNHGWNSITATLPYGCYNYRTTTESYNHVVGSYGAGVNLGRVGWAANGTAIYKYRTTWSSGWKYHCR